MVKRKKSPLAYQPSPSVRENFRREIEKLLGEVPAEQWDAMLGPGQPYLIVMISRQESRHVQTAC
jgi:hypothetical protein